MDIYEIGKLKFVEEKGSVWSHPTMSKDEKSQIVQFFNLDIGDFAIFTGSHVRGYSQLLTRHGLVWMYDK